jgi:hypothetical protein
VSDTSFADHWRPTGANMVVTVLPGLLLVVCGTARIWRREPWYSDLVDRSMSTMVVIRDGAGRFLMKDGEYFAVLSSPPVADFFSFIGRMRRAREAM